MNRTLQNMEARRRQVTAQFVRNIHTAADDDLEKFAEPIPDSELDEEGRPTKGRDGEIITYRQGKWWRARPAALLEILDYLPPLPPDLKIVE
jgi:hypothetical protein